MSARVRPPAAEIQRLLGVIDQAYDQQAWHGTNLRGALRGVDARQALWRPAHDRHNIWEVAVHAAYWKYAVRRRLTGEKRAGFPMAGSNWWRRPDGDSSTAAWRRDLRLLGDMHRELRSTIASFPSRRLGHAVGASRHRVCEMIAGIAMHDVYHAGQIQLLKRLSEV